MHMLTGQRVLSGINKRSPADSDRVEQTNRALITVIYGNKVETRCWACVRRENVRFPSQVCSHISGPLADSLDGLAITTRERASLAENKCPPCAHFSRTRTFHPADGQPLASMNFIACPIRVIKRALPSAAVRWWCDVAAIN